MLSLNPVSTHAKIVSGHQIQAFIVIKKSSESHPISQVYSINCFDIMHCPYCDHTDSRVLESRATGAGRSIRRRRECLSCKHRFTTYERIEFVPISVIKRNGQSEAFDRSKLVRGMARACEKTSVTPSTIEAITEEIETQLQQSPKRSSSQSLA